MKLKHLFIAATIFLSVCSCEKATTVEDESIVNIGTLDDVKVLSEGFSSSVTYEDEAISLTAAEGVTTKSTNAIQLILESSVESPTLADGTKLSASCVNVSPVENLNKVYVTYNLAGDSHGGALVVIDLSDKTAPKIVNEVIFEDIDINVCEIKHDGSMIWLGGSSFKSGAILMPAELDNDGALSMASVSNFETVNLEDIASINGIVEGGDWLLITAGNTNGGTFALNYNQNYKLQGTDPFSNAKYSYSNGHEVGDNHVSLEAGTQGLLHAYSIGTNDENIEPTIALGSISHSGDNTTQGKATCFMNEGSTTCYIAKGQYGFIVVDITQSSPLMVSPADLLIEGNTNAICADDEFVYLANGADGLVICDNNFINSIGVVTSSVLYRWDETTTGASANFVTMKNGYLFVAKGANGGLKILKKN